MPVFPSGLRYAKKAGPNRHFLDATYFIEMVLAPFDQAFREHTGPFILEFQRSGLEAETFVPKLDAFLGKIPTRYEYAIEVRNPAIISPRYRSILKAHGAAHIYNYYTRAAVAVRTTYGYEGHLHRTFYRDAAPDPTQYEIP